MLLYSRETIGADGCVKLGMIPPDGEGVKQRIRS